MRNRTISWMEGQILKQLAKEQSIVLTKMRSMEEVHNYDIALVNLISRKVVTRIKNDSGHPVYRLAA